MKWRWITAVIAMLYLSVGLVAAVAHDHSGHELGGQHQCDACAWHHESQADVPVAGPSVSAASFVLIGHEAPVVLIFDSAVGIHLSRGPPSIPQL
jgi:hypothetical protein